MARYFPRKPSLLFKGAAALGIAVLASLTWKQCQFWKNDWLLWERAVAVDPANRIAHYNLGTLYIGTDPKTAIQEFLIVLNLDPNDADAHYNLASLYSQSGQHPLALLHYQETLRLRPKSLQTLNNMALVYFAMGKTRDAMNLLDRALAEDGGFAEGRFNRGALLIMQGERKKGEMDIRQAIVERPDLRPRAQKLGISDK